jgi:hypothetical protein
MAEAMSDHAARLERVEAARGVAEALDDAALGRLLRDGRDGWGRACRATVSAHRVFAKAVPVTDVEYRAGLSTDNLYEIPSYLNYPFGSPGLGAGRELAFAQTSTGQSSSTCTTSPPAPARAGTSTHNSTTLAWPTCSTELPAPTPGDKQQRS